VKDGFGPLDQARAHCVCSQVTRVPFPLFKKCSREKDSKQEKKIILGGGCSASSCAQSNSRIQFVTSSLGAIKRGKGGGEGSLEKGRKSGGAPSEPGRLNRWKDLQGGGWARELI